MMTKVVHEPETTNTYDANDKPLRIINSTKLYVHAGGIAKLVNFLVCERPAVSAILESGFCDQFVECINPKTCLVELVDASTVPLARHYGKQRLAVTKNTNAASFLKRKRRVVSQVRSTQRVRISKFV